MQNGVEPESGRGFEHLLQVHPAQGLSAGDVQRLKVLSHDAQDLDRLFGGNFLAQDVRIFLRAVMTGKIAAVGDVKNGRKGFDHASAIEQPHVHRVPGVLPEHAPEERLVALDVGGERLQPRARGWSNRGLGR